jgi:hypothetical protein
MIHTVAHALALGLLAAVACGERLAVLEADETELFETRRGSAVVELPPFSLGGMDHFSNTLCHHCAIPHSVLSISFSSAAPPLRSLGPDLTRHL